MRVSMLLTSLTLWMLENTGLLHCVNGQDIFYDRYTIRTCDDNSTRYITHGSRSDVFTARNSIHCAAKCQRNEMCNYAIFVNGSDQNLGMCHIIFSIFKTDNKLTSLLSENILSERRKLECQVISRQNSQPNWEAINISNISRLYLLPTFVPLKIISKFTLQQINDLSELRISNNKVAVSTVGHRISHTAQEARVSSPVRIKLTRLSLIDVTVNQQVDHVKFDGSIHKSDIKEFTPDSFYILAKTSYESADGLPKIYAVSDVNDVIQCIQNGYRRLVNHPSILRIDSGLRRASSDVSEVLKASFNLKANSPIWVYFVKETIGDDINELYNLAYGCNSERSTPPGVSQSLLPWWFDLNWEPIVIPVGRDSVNSLLRDVIIQGREIRAVVDSEMSADLVTATIIPNGDVLATLPQETIPQIGREAADQYTILSSRFAVISGNGLRLHCTYFLHTSTISATGIMARSNTSIKWFVSKNAWEKKLVLENGAGVVFGSNSDLVSLAESGKTLRVCVVKKNGVTTCFTSTSLSVPSSSPERIILQSIPFIDLEVMYDEAQKSPNTLAHTACRRISLTVSSAGLISEQEINFGVVDQPTFVYVDFERIEWFVEMA